jgi:hypothetical protein
MAFGLVFPLVGILVFPGTQSVEAQGFTYSVGIVIRSCVPHGPDPGLNLGGECKDSNEADVLDDNFFTGNGGRMGPTSDASVNCRRYTPGPSGTWTLRSGFVSPSGDPGFDHGFGGVLTPGTPATLDHAPRVTGLLDFVAVDYATQSSAVVAGIMIINNATRKLIIASMKAVITGVTTSTFTPGSGWSAPTFDRRGRIACSTAPDPTAVYENSAAILFG